MLNHVHGKVTHRSIFHHVASQRAAQPPALIKAKNCQLDGVIQVRFTLVVP